METSNTTQYHPKRVFINAKVTTSVHAVFKDGRGKPIREYTGPVPDFMPDKHWGDYVLLEIDIETGRILNWKATREDVADFINNPKYPKAFSEPQTYPDM